MRRTSKLVTLAFLALASHATAEEITFDFEATLNFPPDRFVSRAGGTMAALFAELTGPAAATGQATVTGAISYRRDVAPIGSGMGSTGYADAITAATVRVGGVDLVLDLARVQGNRASSRVGYSALPQAGFCPAIELCEAAGLPMTPTGNTVQVVNDAPHFVMDETGVTSYAPSDVVAFLVGRTDAMGEFAPALQTAGFGVVALDGMALALFSGTPGRMLDSGAIPDMRAIAGTTEIQRTEFWLFVEGPELPETLRIEGQVNRIVPRP